MEVDPATEQEKVVFDIADAWRPEDHPIPEYMPRSEWTHANSIFYTPSDPVSHQEAYLISFRVVSAVLLVSRATGEVIGRTAGIGFSTSSMIRRCCRTATSCSSTMGSTARGSVSLAKWLRDRSADRPDRVVVLWLRNYRGELLLRHYRWSTATSQREHARDAGHQGPVHGGHLERRVVWDYHVGSNMADPKYPTQPWNLLFKSRGLPAGRG